MTEYTIKTEDSYPLFETELDINLSSASEVRLYVEHAADETLVVNEPVTIADPTTGAIEYQFTSAETARDGFHRAELVVDYGDGTRSFPESGFYTFEFTTMVDRSQNVDPAVAGSSFTEVIVYGTSDLRGDVELGGDIDVGGNRVHNGTLDGSVTTMERTVPDGESLLVRDDTSAVVAGPYSIEGTLDVNGVLQVL